MTDNDLFSIVIHIRPFIEREIKAAPWYGQAINAEIYKSINRIDRCVNQVIHNGDIDPFTVSSLFFLDGNSTIHNSILPNVQYPQYLYPQHVLSFRITGLNPLTGFLLDTITSVGHTFGIGSIITLCNHRFVVEDVNWNPSRHLLASVSSYELLWKNVVSSLSNQASIRFLFFSPFTTKNGNYYNPLLSKETLFLQPAKHFRKYCPQKIMNSFEQATFRQNLKEWFDPGNNKDNLPIVVANFLKTSVFIKNYYLKSTNVRLRSLITCGIGNIEIATEKPSDPSWFFLRLLASYSFYSGIGKDTASGLGQVWVESQEPM